MFQGNLLPQQAYARVRESQTMIQRHSDIEKIRKTGRISNISGLSGLNSK